MSFELLAGMVLAHGYLVVFPAVGAAMWASSYVLVGYGAGANLGGLQRQWASAMPVVQIALAIGLVGFVMVRFSRARWLRIAVGAALLAMFSVRATTMVTE